MRIPWFDYAVPMTILRPLPVGIGEVSQVFGANIADYAAAGFAGHEGLDYSCRVGSPVLACTAGKVLWAGWGVRANKPYGLYIIIDHGKFQSWYCHLSTMLVTMGQIVEQGWRIGSSGNTGKTTGPHLHFAIRVPRAKNGSKGFIDPWALRVILGDA